MKKMILTSLFSATLLFGSVGTTVFADELVPTDSSTPPIEVPTDPSTPVDPTEPTTPVDPPVDPVEPPVTPTEPSEPEKPVEPTEPTEPTTPTEPSEPEKPNGNQSKTMLNLKSQSHQVNQRSLKNQRTYTLTNQ